MFAIDAYDSRISPSAFQQFKASNYNLLIQNVWTVIAGKWHSPAAAVPNLRDAQDSGFAIAAYCAVVADGQWSVDQARAVCGDLWPRLSFIALDIEVDGVTLGAIRQAVERVKELGQRPVIYTAYWFWHDRLGNPAGFTDVPLWNAFYDGDPDYDFGRLPYGGWAIDQLAGEQYQGSTRMFGADVDLSQFRDSFLTPASPAPSPSPLEARLKVVEDKMLALESVTTLLTTRLQTIGEDLRRAALGWQLGERP